MSEDYSVRFEHPSAKSFITLMEVLGSIVDEALMNFGEEGLTIKALDPAQIALIDIEIPRDAFLTYDLKGEVFIGVNLANLLKTLPKPKKGDKLVFTGNEQFYEVLLEGVVSKRYRYRSIEVSASKVPDVDLDFKVLATCLAKAFQDAVKDLKGAGSIVFEAQDDQYLYLKAPEINAEAKLSKVAGSILEMEVKTPSRNVYDEDYISKVLKLSTVSNTIDIKFGPDIPLNLSFTIAEGGSVKYLLAPKA
ncbi:MAG: hypothetical protein J7L55_04690 [Desulfurococcales archaeon]|nr:hypothetical protein [Desulfurococcales archaeon]